MVKNPLPSGEVKVRHAGERRHPGDGQASVIPLKNGIQVKGMGMDPGFHRGDDKAWIPVGVYPEYAEGPEGRD
jgi:hypothetical protein